MGFFELADLRACRNDAFRAAVLDREAEDLRLAAAKLRRDVSPVEAAQVGVSRLRAFLERLLQSRYLSSVPAIVPVLEAEFRRTVGILTALRLPTQAMHAARRGGQGPRSCWG